MRLFAQSALSTHAATFLVAGYARAALSDGPGVLSLRCAAVGCPVAAPVPLMLSLLSAPERERYDSFRLRSFVENNAKVRWCPGVGCSRAIERLGGGSGGGGPEDAACSPPAGCGAAFCWQCGAEAHRPLACATVHAWLLKNSAESEDLNWILAHTKPCPKCSRPIEKNQGCMHITCQAPCRHEWCWLCTGAWKDHGERTGGFYACNSYEERRLAGEINDAVRRDAMRVCADVC
jgi:ariadne-1